MTRATPSEAELAALRRTKDPLERARSAGELLTDLLAAQAAAAEIRDRAILDLRGRGWTFAKIGDALGVTRARIQQIERKARRVGR